MKCYKYTKIQCEGRKCFKQPIFSLLSHLLENISRCCLYYSHLSEFLSAVGNGGT